MITGMEPEGVMLSEMSEKYQYGMISLICGIKKKKTRIEPVELLEVKDRMVVARGPCVGQR